VIELRRISDADLHEIERHVATAPDSPLARVAERLLVELRAAYHALDDPQYLYSNGRVPRTALVARDAVIEALRAEIEKLKSPGVAAEPPRRCAHLHTTVRDADSDYSYVLCLDCRERGSVKPCGVCNQKFCTCAADGRR